MKKVFNLLTDLDWNPFLDYLLNLRDKGKLTITIQKYRKKRSINANNYYFGCVVEPLADHLGYTKNEMHDVILGEYYGWETRTFRGKTRQYPRRRSTSPEIADTLDFMGLTQLGQQIAAEEGLILPDQEERYEFER